MENVDVCNSATFHGTIGSIDLLKLWRQQWRCQAAQAVIEACMSHYLSISNKLGLDCVFLIIIITITLHNIVSDYVSQGSTVNLCTLPLHLSKAFD